MFSHLNGTRSGFLGGLIAALVFGTSANVYAQLTVSTNRLGIENTGGQQRL